MAPDGWPRRVSVGDEAPHRSPRLRGFQARAGVLGGSRDSGPHRL